MLTDEQIRTVAEYLEGTCQSIDAAIAACGFSVPDDSQELFDIAVRVEQIGEIFLCDGCGWYCEASEMRDPDENNNEQRCGDCAVEVGDDC